MVLSRSEVMAVLDHVSGDALTASRLMYGCGMRLSECLSVRIKDIDFEKRVVMVRSGKGDRDRVTVFPDSLTAEMKARFTDLRTLYQADRAAGLPRVALPNALEAKYPNAGREWGRF